MRAIERILFPVDFSPNSDGAAHYVKAMADATQAEVTIFHAINSADYLFTAGELGGYVVNDFYQIHLNDTKKKLGDYLRPEFPNANRETCEGEAASRIVAFAKSHDIDLIMLPTHGLGPFRRFLIGSITAKVLHDAHCPVWTGVHMEAAPPRENIKLDRILCCVDLGPQADATLRWAEDFAAAHGGKVTIVHAVPAIETRPAKYFDTEFHAELQRQARLEIEKLRYRVHSDAEVLLVDGDPAKAIRQAAVDRHADMLVIGRGSAGRHSYNIIRNAPCPTVSV